MRDRRRRGGVRPAARLQAARARFFGIDLAAGQGLRRCLRYKLGQIARRRSKRRRCHGRPQGTRRQVVDGMAGAKFERRQRRRHRRRRSQPRAARPVALPLGAPSPTCSAADLAVAATQARTALSAPIRLAYGETRWRVPRWRIAPLLLFPPAAARRVSICGPRRRAVSRAVSAASAQAPGRTSRSRRRARSWSGRRRRAPARRPGHGEGDRRSSVLDRQAHGEARRPGREPAADDGDREDDGHRRASSRPTRRPTAARRGGSTTSSSSPS